MTLSDTSFSSEQAKIAEAAGACAVMALERIPADAALMMQLGAEGVFVG